MDKTTKLLLNLSMFVSIVMIFFGNMLTNLYILQGISFLFAILAGYRKKIKIKPDTIFWLFTCLVSIFSITISEDKQSTVEIAAMINMIVIIKMIYENNESGWHKKIITLITIASGVHVMATIIQLILPNFITTINRVLLSTKDFNINQEFYKRGAYAGLTVQTSVNAYYIAIFIGAIFSKIISRNKKKKIDFFFLILAIITLFMTGKRGILLFTVVSLIFVIFYTIRKDKKNFFKYIASFVVIISVGYVALINIPETKIIFDKMELLEKNDDVLNGRDYLWEESIKIFTQNMAFGIGEGRINGILGDGSHNIYIQLLAETGIIGFVIYILAFLVSLIITIKKAKIILKQGNENIKRTIILSIFMQILFLTYGFTGNPLYSNIFFTPYMLAIAMANVIQIKESEEKNESRNNYIP